MFKLLIQYCNSHHVQMIKFIFIGILTFIINFSCFHFFYGIYSLDLKIATSLSYLITVTSHFSLHRIITFKVKMNEQKLVHNIGKYLILLLINYLITLSAMLTTVRIIHLSAYFGVIAATGATALSSFFLMKYFVFTNQRSIYG